MPPGPDGARPSPSCDNFHSRTAAALMSRGITPESDNSFRGITLTISWIGHHRRDPTTGVGKVRPRRPPSGSAHGDGIRSIGLVVGGIRFADEIRLHHGCRDRNRRGTCPATPTRRLAGVRVRIGTARPTEHGGDVRLVQLRDRHSTLGDAASATARTGQVSAAGGPYCCGGRLTDSSLTCCSPCGVE
jgi:hypothetical protein